MDIQIQIALIAAVASLSGVLIGALPTYLISRSQHKMELQRQILEWRKEYREKMLSKVEEVLTKRAQGIQVPPSLHLVGVFDPDLAVIMKRISTETTLPDEFVIQAFKRMDELMGEIDFKGSSK